MGLLPPTADTAASPREAPSYHVIILDLGPAEEVTLNIESLGRQFEPIERTARIL